MRSPLNKKQLKEKFKQLSENIIFFENMLDECRKDGRPEMNLAQNIYKMREELRLINETLMKGSR